MDKVLLSATTLRWWCGYAKRWPGKRFAASSWEMRSLGFTDDEVMRLTAEALHNTELREEETDDAEGGI